LAMAYLAAASGAAPKDSRFAPYANSAWSVAPIIWIMTIADSGQRKTAIEDLAFAALRGAHAEKWRAHSNRMRAWRVLPTKTQRVTPNSPLRKSPLQTRGCGLILTANAAD
jgi:hypothetical protein